MLVEDDKGDPKEASLVADRLASKKVMAVIGALQLQRHRAGFRHLQSREYPAHYAVFHGDPVTRERLPELLPHRFLDDRQGLFAADFMTKVLNDKNIAILHDNSTYAQGLAEGTKKYLEEQGVKLGVLRCHQPERHRTSARP